MPDFRNWSEQELLRLKRRVDRLFDDLCDEFGLPGICEAREHLDTHTEETPEEIIIRIALPGCTADDIKLDVTERSLHLVWQRHAQLPGGTRTESGERRLALHVPVRPDATEALLSDDILEIRLRKAEPRTRISIETS